MAKKTGKHLTIEQRQIIEQGLLEQRSCRFIAKSIGAAPSTVLREVEINRTIKDKKRTAGGCFSSRCKHYRDCQESGTACAKCSTTLTTCKKCRTRQCIDYCSKFERVMCSDLLKWPYICPPFCPKKARCSFPKASYVAASAQASYSTRLSDSRAGIAISQEELEDMQSVVEPLAKQGQSMEAIWITHGTELPVCVRTAYNYLDAGVFNLAAMELPRKVRMRPRKKKDNDPKHERVDRTGRTYDDFKVLPIDDIARCVQGDSVVGFEDNRQDLLSLFIVACGIHLYLGKKHASARATVECLDFIERTLGSPDAFKAIFPILLLDRGTEFDDWAGMERSCLVEGARRTRVFYCDAMDTNQKSQCERDHERLRRILPKGRSDFDKLSAYDIAVFTSHVNSYPLVSREGKCPLELAEGLLPKRLLDELGVVRVAPDEVVLKPYLIKHAVEQ